jgi:hypothetical protein
MGVHCFRKLKFCNTGIVVGLSVLGRNEKEKNGSTSIPPTTVPLTTFPLNDSSPKDVSPNKVIPLIDISKKSPNKVGSHFRGSVV